MNRFIRSSIIALTFASAGIVAASASDGSALIDFGNLSPSAHGEFVEINLGAPLLKFAAICADKQKPAAAELLRGLKQVRVHVIELDDTNRAAMTDRVTTIRRDLAKQGWSQIVTARGKKSEDVAIFAKTDADETIQGLVVTVLKDGKQAVLVNIVGEIKAGQIATLAEQLNIDGLKVAAKATAP